MINKLDLLGKGWKTSEIEQASKILAEAEDKKHSNMRLFDKLLIIILVVLMLINGFVCSIVLIPFIYVMQNPFIIVITAVIGFIFGILFSVIMNDIEKIHKSEEANMMVVLLANALVSFYLIITFTQEFGTRSGLSLINNIYVIAAAYVLAFILPHVIYELKKQNG